ncbi:MAG: hypothetical protein NTW87_10205 [Planctomycetota bacterium]|nr:hypothetical protein [Planctomycetota bacterium]
MMTVALVLRLSCTSTKDTALVPLGLMFHCVPGVPLRNESNWPAAPCNVSVPLTVCVEPAAKVSVAADVTDFVKLLKLLFPEIDWFAPFRVIPLNDVVPLLLLKFPVKVTLTMLFPVGKKLMVPVLLTVRFPEIETVLVWVFPVVSRVNVPSTTTFPLTVTVLETFLMNRNVEPGFTVNEARLFVLVLISHRTPPLMITASPFPGGVDPPTVDQFAATFQLLPVAPVHVVVPAARASAAKRIVSTPHSSSALPPLNRASAPRNRGLRLENVEADPIGLFEVLDTSSLISARQEVMAAADP